MKSFKKLLGAVVLSSAVVMSCLTFAGCGGDDNDGKGGNTGVNAQFHEGKVQDDLPDMSKVVSEKVADEAAWEAAFNYDGSENITAYMVHERSQNNTVNDAIYNWTKIDGNKSYNYIKYIEEKGEDKLLVSACGEAYGAGTGEDARVYMYDGNDTYWHTYPATTDYLIHEFFDFIYTPFNRSKLLADDDYTDIEDVGFADLKYENGAYQYTYEDKNGSYIRYVCKIVDGKVVYAKNEYKRFITADKRISDGRTEESYFYNIGTTKLSLPTKTKAGFSVPDVKGEEVTSAQWESAVAKTVYDNFAVNVVESDYDETNKLSSRSFKTSKYDLANGVCKGHRITTSNAPLYALHTNVNNGGIEHLSNDNKNWYIDGESSGLNPSEYYSYVKPIEGKFGAFTFDAEKGEYILENATIDIYYDEESYDEVTYNKVVVTFKDGKLVKACFTEKYDDTTSESACYFSDYGEVKIAVPKV